MKVIKSLPYSAVFLGASILLNSCGHGSSTGSGSNGGGSGNSCGSGSSASGSAQVLLSVASINVSPTAGNANVALLTLTAGSQSPWTATTSTSWVHLLDTCGTTERLGSVIRFTYDANSSATRTGTINFQSVGFTGTVTVTQAGIGYVATLPLPTELTALGLNVGTLNADIAGNIYFQNHIGSSGTVGPLQELLKASGALSTLSITTPCGDVPANNWVVDEAGSIYFQACNSIYEWMPATQQLTSIPNPMPTAASALATDLHGDIFAAYTDGSNNSKVFNLTHPNTGSTANLTVPSFEIGCLSVDAGDNAFITGSPLPLIQGELSYSLLKGNLASGTVATLASSNTGAASGCGLDASENVYFVFTAGGTNVVGSYLVQWSPLSGSTTQLSELNAVNNVTGDGLGNLYVVTEKNPSVGTTGAVEQFTPVYVNTANVTEPVTAGSDQLPPVLPTSTMLNAVSDSSWLTIANQANGIVSFAFTAATAARTAHITLLDQTITISQGSPSPQLVPNTFVPITPCRTADAQVGASASRDFLISQGPCNIPPNAQAYSLNVTAAPQGKLSFLAISPMGGEQPSVSTLSSDGRTKSVAAIVPAGLNGGVSVRAADATQVVLDINGYFVPAGSANAALAFYPVAPCRIADTRNGTGPFGGPYLTGGRSRPIPVGSSNCNVPASAQAYSLNLTLVPHKESGYLTAWPTGQSMPLLSILNSSQLSVTANAAIVKAGTGGSINVYSSSDADLAVDINGYFAPLAQGGLSLYTSAPCRLLDTRDSAAAARIIGRRSVNALGRSCDLSADAQALVLNVTALPTTSLGYLSLWPDRQAQPWTSTLNADRGVATSNMAIVPTTNGIFRAYASEPAHLILDYSSYFAP